jgi:hypothetical protein
MLLAHRLKNKFTLKCLNPEKLLWCQGLFSSHCAMLHSAVSWDQQSSICPLWLTDDHQQEPGLFSIWHTIDHFQNHNFLIVFFGLCIFFKVFFKLQWAMWTNTFSHGNLRIVMNTEVDLVDTFVLLDSFTCVLMGFGNFLAEEILNYKKMNLE